jgi:hypothetical protein
MALHVVTALTLLQVACSGLYCLNLLHCGQQRISTVVLQQYGVQLKYALLLHKTHRRHFICVSDDTLVLCTAWVHHVSVWLALSLLRRWEVHNHDFV